MSQEASGPYRFACTQGGTIAAGSRRLSRLFTLLTLLMIAAAAAAWLSSRLVPGLLALAVAGLVALARRLSVDLRPRLLELRPGVLVIETHRQPIEIDIEGAEIRRLERGEIEHLERMASSGGFVAGSGGFDSRHLGEFDLYASDFDNSLYIRGLAARLVLTPDQPDEFLPVFRRMASLPPATILTS